MVFHALAKFSTNSCDSSAVWHPVFSFETIGIFHVNPYAERWFSFVQKFNASSGFSKSVFHCERVTVPVYTPRKPQLICLCDIFFGVFVFAFGVAQANNNKVYVVLGNRKFFSLPFRNVNAFHFLLLVFVNT